MTFPIDMTNGDAYLEDSRSPSTVGYIPPLILQPRYGFVPQRFNPGFPEIRDVSDKRPSQNGTFDYTQFFGSRPVTLEVTVSPESQANPLKTDQLLEDELRRWMLPDIRCYLYIRFSPLETYRRYKLRASNVNSSLSFMKTNEFRSVSMSWKGVDGISEAGTLETNSLDPSTATELGRTYDLTFDRTYAASSVAGTKVIRNSGNVSVFPVVRIYGPCTQPRIENQTTGKKLEFLAAYALASTDYLLIDFAEGSVFINGDPTNSRYDKIDMASGISEWWSLIPGNNALRYYPLSSSAPSKAIIEWRSGYI